VLAGGGTYLFTHIGMLEALEDGGLLDGAEAQQIGGVYGNSAGSVVGALFAQGYRPHRIWQLANWTIWGAQAPEDGSLWRYRQFQHPYDLSAFLAPDEAVLRRALTQNLSYLKGVLSPAGFLPLMRDYLYGGARYTELAADPAAIRPPALRYPFYAIITNLSTTQELIARYAAHLEAPPLAALSAEAAPAAAPPFLVTPQGREHNYAFFDDLALADRPESQRLTVSEAVYASIAQPVLFEPFYKPDGLWLWQRLAGDAELQLDHTWPYLVDGGVRDDYPLSIAVKVGGHTRVFGQMLGAPGYPFRAIGQGTVVDVLFRIVYDTLLKTIYEADQDDVEIIAQQIRSVVPYIAPRQQGLFDAGVAGQARDAGYLTGAYYLYRVAQVRGEAGDDPQPFLRELLSGKRATFTWEQVFDQRLANELVARSHARTTGHVPATDGYRLATPQDSQSYVRLGQALLNDYAHWRYPNSVYGPATMLETREDDPSAIGKRERERHDIGPTELDSAIFQGELQVAQRQFVGWVDLALWIGVWGALLLLYVLLLLIVGLFANTSWAARPLALLITLVISGGLARLVYHLLLEQAWRVARGFISSRLTGK
jgi:predicted acylesterase/phospholipase RssA